MFGLGMPELIVILVIMVLLFGSKRLPELGRGLGKSIREFRTAAEEISNAKPDADEGEAEKDAAAKPAEKDREVPDTGGQQEGSELLGVKEEINKLPGAQEVKDLKDKTASLKKITGFLGKRIDRTGIGGYKP